MTVLVALLPALILFIGAGLLWVGMPLPARLLRVVPILAVVLAGVGLVYAARASDVPVTLFPPSDVLPALSVTLQWSGIALPIGLFVLTILAGRLLMGIETDERALTAGSLVASGGALLFFASDNWTTLAAAWLIVEFGLLIVPADASDDRDAPAHAFGWNLAGIVAWLAAGMIMANEGSSLRLEQAAIGDHAALLVFLAVWIRSGCYPFQAAAPANSENMGVRLGIPLLLGGYLMTRLLGQTTAPMAWSSLAEIVAILALGISAFLVVGQPHGADSFLWGMRAFAAPLLILPFLVDPQLAPAVGLGLMLATFVACNLISVALMWRAQLPHLPLTAVVWIAVLFVMAMLPFTPAFWSHVGLLADAFGEGRLPLWLILVGTLSLILIPAWREIFASREVASKAPSRHELAALLCLLAAIFIAGAVPFLFNNPFGQVMQASATLAGDAVFHSRDFGTLIFTLAGLGVPLLASFELARRWDRRANLVPLRVADVLDLSGVSRGLDMTYRLVCVLVQQGMSILEQPPIAWLIFVAIWMAVWLNGQ